MTHQIKPLLRVPTYHIRALGQDLDALLLTRLPADVPGKQ